MKNRSLLMVIAFWLIAGSALAQECTELLPTPGTANPTPLLHWADKRGWPPIWPSMHPMLVAPITTMLPMPKNTDTSMIMKWPKGYALQDGICPPMPNGKPW